MTPVASPPVSRTPAPDAVASTERGLAGGAVIWQALWQAGIARDASGWPSLAAALFALSAVSLLGIAWTSRPGGSRVARAVLAAVDIAALYLAGLVLVVALPLPAAGGLTTGATLCGLALGVAGLLLPIRISRPLLVLLVIVEAGALLLLMDDKQGFDVATVVLNPVNSLALAVVTVAIRHALMRSARDTDAAATSLLDVEASAAAAAAAERRLLVEERLLHETVLNTLTAIVRGGIGESEESRALLRARCVQSAQVLRDFDVSRRPVDGTRPQDDLAQVTALVRASGATLTLDADALHEVEPAAYVAVIGAVREALLNVARHARATDVSVVAARGDGGGVDIVVRDDGVGFDATDIEPRFGIERAITESVRLVGGSARVDAAPGAGTAVTLTWRPRPVRRSAWAGVTRDAFTVPVIAVYGAYALLSIVMTSGDVSDKRLSLLAVGLSVVAGAVLLRSSRRGSLTTESILAVLALAPLIYRLQKMSTADSTAPWVEWSSLVVNGLFFIIAARGPWWAWAGALGTWLAIQGDPLHELLQPGTAFLVAGGVVGYLLRRSAAQIDVAVSAAAEQAVASQAAGDAIARLRDRYAALAHSDAAALLTAIADDDADPADDDVRHRCAVEEGFIRTVMRLDPSTDWVQRLAVVVASHARELGVRLDADISARPSERCVEPAGLEDACIDVLAYALRREPVRLTARREGEGLTIRLVLHADGGMPARPEPKPGARYAILSHEDDDGTGIATTEVMIEATCAGTSRPEERHG